MSEDVNTDLSCYNVKIVSTILTDNYVSIVFEGNNLHGDYNFPNCMPVLAQVIKDLMYTLDASSWEKISGSYCRVLVKGCDVIGIRNIVTDKEFTFNSYIDSNNNGIDLVAALGNAQAMMSPDNIAKRREEHNKKLSTEEAIRESTQDNPNTRKENDN